MAPYFKAKAKHTRPCKICAPCPLNRFPPLSLHSHAPATVFSSPFFSNTSQMFPLALDTLPDSPLANRLASFSSLFRSHSCTGVQPGHLVNDATCSILPCSTFLGGEGMLFIFLLLNCKN